MGAVGSLLGIGGQGANFQAAGVNEANSGIYDPTNSAQINNSYNQVQSGLTQQQQLAQALSGQGAQGMNTQTNLTNMLTGQANGTGPNPALAQLNQTTGTNVANQAALAAGQRGAGSNVGLMARQAAQTGANTQQQAVGQAATQEANQQIAAEGQLQNLAGTQVNQQGSAVSNLANSQQAEQGQLLGAAANTNNANVSLTNGQNASNEGIAAGNAANTGKALGGIGQAAGTALDLFAKGGEVEDHIRHMATIYHPRIQMDSIKTKAGSMKQGGEIPGKANVKGDSVKNDNVLIAASPKEIVLPRSVTQAKDAPEQAKQFVAALLRKQGGGSASDEHDDFKNALKKAISSRKKKVA